MGDRHRANPAKDRKMLMELMYERVFTEIAMARFKWKGLPESINVRFLEHTLFYRALSVFYFDKDYDKHFALKGAASGPVNMYDEPTAFRVFGNSLINKELRAMTTQDKDGGGRKNPQCVPIWANRLRMPDHDIALIYATKMAEIERTIEINVMAMRHPFIVAVDDTDKLTLQNALRQVVEGQPVIFGTQAMADSLDNKARLLDMKIDKDLAPNLQLVKAKQWNDCMTFLGINNANQDKRERLVTSEVSANNSQVLMARNSALDARRFACEQINSLYDLNVSVDWNVDVELIAQEAALAEGVSDS